MDKSERKKILNKIDIGEILNQLHSGLSICNENGEMLYITENYEEIYGIKIEDVMGRCNREFTATKNPISDNVLESGKKLSRSRRRRLVIPCLLQEYQMQ